MSGAPGLPHAAGPAPHVLREYALIADGQRGALVGPHGEIAWMCAPTWDSGAVFSSLLGGRSHLQVQPVGRYVWGGYYEPGSGNLPQAFVHALALETCVRMPGLLEAGPG